jgi:putative nucleotidyltransferase with HDIG domain
MSDNQPMQRILEDIQDIPPLPEVVSQVMELTNDPDASAAELNRVISKDEALTANLLKLCNSSYYGLPRVISSVTQAIMYLGFQTVRNMVLSSTLDQILKQYDLSLYNYKPNGLAEHSFAVAVGAQVISKRLRPGLRDTAFTAGLLHDVGKIILARYVAESKDKLVSAGDSSLIDLAAEKEVFGVDHAEVGARVADSWNFPQELTLAIGYHHQPEAAKGRPLLAVIVYLSDIVCLRLGKGLLSGPIEREISPYCLESTGIGEGDMPALCEEVAEAIASMSEPNPKA